MSEAKFERGRGNIALGFRVTPDEFLLLKSNVSTVGAVSAKQGWDAISGPDLSR